MNTVWTLFMKEWKDSRSLIGFLLVALAALEIYGWYYYDPSLVGRKSQGWRYIPFVVCVAGSFLAPCFLLARSFSSEWKSETHYQWFALPVQKWVSVLCKYVAALSQGVLLIAYAFLGLSLMSLTIEHMRERWILIIGQMSELSISEWAMVATDLAVVFILPVIIHLMLTLALVTAMESVKFTVHRYRGLVSLMFFGVTIYLFGRLFEGAVEALQFLGHYKPMTIWQNGSMDLVIIAYPLLVTLLLMAVGLWFFEKRVEI